MEERILKEIQKFVRSTILDDIKENVSDRLMTHNYNIDMEETDFTDGDEFIEFMSEVFVEEFNKIEKTIKEIK